MDRKSSGKRANGGGGESGKWEILPAL